jgi:hypothetical protein
VANIYVQFSEVIQSLTPAEEAWLRERLPSVSFSDRIEAAEDDELVTDDDWLGFDHEFRFYDSSHPNAPGRYLWLYAMEGGEPERVAAFVQDFLRKFRPNQCWSLTYAITCSSPRVGDFTGGACFVTADEVRWEGAAAWAEEQKQAFADAQKT